MTRCKHKFLDRRRVLGHCLSAVNIPGVGILPASSQAISNRATILSVAGAGIGKPGPIEFWDVINGVRLNLEISLGNRVFSPRFTPDRKSLTAFDDHALFIFDVADGKLRQKILIHQQELRVVAIDSENRLVLAKDDSEPYLIQLQSGNRIDLEGSDMAPISVAKFIKNNSQLLIVTENGLIKIWSVTDGSLINRFGSEAEMLYLGRTRGTLSTDESTLMTIDNENGAIVWKNSVQSGDR